MNLRLSDRVTRIQPSPTIAVSSKAAELRAAGRDVIALSAGEPDFDTPQHIREAAKQAIDEGYTKYTPADGMAALKEAIAEKFKGENQLSYSPGQIIVSNGAKHSLFNVFQAVLDPIDEVIVPSPYWVSYPDMVLLAGGRPVIVNTDMAGRFKLRAEELDAALTPRTRIVLINSPSNPTGSCYTRAELASLGEVLRNHPGVLVVSDDIYERIQWGAEPFSNIAMKCPDLYDRTVVVNGVSKAYAMTGWRIGYAAAPRVLAEAMKTIQSQSTSNAASVSQMAALAALRGDQQCVSGMVRTFKERHDYVVARLNGLRGVTCLPAEGAFYAFPDIRGAMAERPDIADDAEFAEYLLDAAGVAVVPGTAFGAPGHLRISYATSMVNLQVALDRLERVFGNGG